MTPGVPGGPLDLRGLALGAVSWIAALVALGGSRWLLLGIAAVLVAVVTTGRGSVRRWTWLGWLLVLAAVGGSASLHREVVAGLAGA